MDFAHAVADGPLLIGHADWPCCLRLRIAFHAVGRISDEPELRPALEREATR